MVIEVPIHLRSRLRQAVLVGAGEPWESVPFIAPAVTSVSAPLSTAAFPEPEPAVATPARPEEVILPLPPTLEVNGRAGDTGFPEPPPPHPAEDPAVAEQRIALDRVMHGLEQVGADLRGQQRQRLAEMQQVALEVAFAVAEQFLRQRLGAGQFAIENMVQRVIDAIPQPAAVTVHLNPDDLALLKTRSEELRLTLLDTPDLRLASDPGLARGDCRAETADLAVVSRIGDQLAELRQGVIESLPEAQVERRKTLHGIRPFPERRHTA